MGICIFSNNHSKSEEMGLSLHASFCCEFSEIFYKVLAVHGCYRSSYSWSYFPFSYASSYNSSSSSSHDITSPFERLFHLLKWPSANLL